MQESPQLEIPEAVRELAERNVEQARTAYGQFMEMARQTQEMVAKSQGAMAAGALEVQTQALRFAEQNIDASFNCAAELAKSRDIKQYLEVQSRYAQSQMKVYAQQAQALGRLMAEAAQRAQSSR